MARLDRDVCAAAQTSGSPRDKTPGTWLEFRVSTLGNMMNLTSPAMHFFDSHRGAELAIHALHEGGFDVRKLSLVSKGFHSEEHPVGFYTHGDRVRSWGREGAFWGGIWGLLMSPAVFFVPTIGLLTLAGPVVVALVGALEGAVLIGGMSALGAALTQIGFSQDGAVKYETALKADKYILTVHGTLSDAADANIILSKLGPAAV